MSMPGILQQLARANPMTQRIKQMMSLVSGAQDPQAMLSRMMAGNPQMKQAMDIISASGGDARKAFYALAEEKGVDPQQILDMMK